jgi:hypothetical protein
MQKTDLLRYSRYLIFLAVFNTSFFLLGGFERNVSVWLSYGFIHFACFMLFITTNLVRTSQSEAVFRWSLYYISSIYFVVEFFVGVLFILLALEGYKAAFLIQFCIASFYGFVMAYYLLANEWTADTEAQRQTQIASIKSASVTVKGLLDRINDKTAKRKVERVYDALYSSPAKSSSDLEVMEHRILQSIRELEDVVVDGNRDNIIALAESLEVAIDERNSRLKTYN